MRRNATARAILTGGAIAGALDITYAFVLWGLRGVPPIRILQAVASGLPTSETRLIQEVPCAS